jgi:hypothetical protein
MWSSLRQSLGSLWPKVLAGGAFSAVSLTLTVLPAHASSPAPAGSTGYDISWPQCPSNFPAGASFGIVGVTNGLAFSANPCLKDEYTWASGRPYAAGLYLNTGNPETASSNWPGRAGVGPRTCQGSDLSDPSNVNCAYNYGWNAATDAFKVASANVGTAAQTQPWWLDVETGNSWNGTTAANSSTVQGYVDYLRSQGTGTVGIYSTGLQWGQITGGYAVPSAPDWLAGASTAKQAASMCKPANSFSGGAVQLVQYPRNGFDGDYVCSTAAASPDYSLAATPTSRTVAQGAATNYTIGITPSGGFNGLVTLSSSGLPSGASTSFSPDPASGTSTMSLTTSTSTPAGSFVLTVTGASGTLSHTTTMTLVVRGASTPDYSLSASPASRAVIQGGSTSFAISITSTGGFTGLVTLSASGLPSGTSASFSPNPTSNTSTMSVRTSSSTPAGTYVTTITGVSGGITHTLTVTVVVTSAAPPPCDGQC